MIIELPREFTFFNETGEIVAYVENGVLKLKNTASYKKVIFELTYEMKGRKRCCYCGRTVDTKEMTLDHMYPQDFGGPTITNNLLPSCQEISNCKKARKRKRISRRFKKISFIC